MNEEKVQKDIDNLYSKTNELDKRQVEIEVNQKHYTDTLEKVVESNEKLAEALHGIQLAFTTMNVKIDEMSNNIADTKHQVNGINIRMDTIEDKSKFDMMEFLKKYFPWIVIGIGAVGLWANQYFKF